MIERTRRVRSSVDGEAAFSDLAARGGFASYEIKTLDNVRLCREVQQLEMTLQEVQKGEYKHFMLKEICEQPEVLENAMRGRLNLDAADVNLGGLTPVMERLKAAPRIIIVACGTSWHAGLLGEYLIEQMARVPVEVEYGSEFRYRQPLIFDDDVMIAISRSGETADTLAALSSARPKGCLCLGVCNSVGSTIARESDAGVYLHAGSEIGVASTKAFSAQIIVLMMIALKLAKERGALDDGQIKERIAGLQRLPELMRGVLKQKENVLQMSKVFRYASNFLYLGRGVNFPVALEGALKLKEISYIHAEGYPAAEMKHGPIALIDPFMPVVIIAPRRDPNYLKLVSNIEEVLARGGFGDRDHRGRQRRPRREVRVHRPQIPPATRRVPAPPSSRWCRCSCSRTTSPTCASATSTSRATSRRASPSSEVESDPNCRERVGCPESIRGCYVVATSRRALCSAHRRALRTGGQRCGLCSRAVRPHRPASSLSLAIRAFTFGFTKPE